MNDATPLALSCEYFRAEICHSCEWLSTPYSDQLTAKTQRAHELLEPFAAPAGIEWSEPFESLPESFRNKVKLVVTGSLQHPKLGILTDPRTGTGADLRECPLPTLGIREAIAPIADFIHFAKLQPYNMRTDQGVLKYVIIMESPLGELMVRFVVRRRGAQGSIFRHYADLQEALPMLRVCSINVQPEHTAVIEGAEEILVSEDSVLPMPLELSSPSSGQCRSTTSSFLDAEPTFLGVEPTGNAESLVSIEGVASTPCPVAPTSASSAGTNDDVELLATNGSVPHGLSTVQKPAAPHPIWPRELELGVTPGAFFQTNTAAAEVLYSRAREWLTRSASSNMNARSTGSKMAPNNAAAETAGATKYFNSAVDSNHASPAEGASSHTPYEAWDLYCGVGGFGLALAATGSWRVTGVETSAAAVQAAQWAADRITPGSVAQFVAADALTWAREQQTAGAPTPDAVIVNPPRRGIGAELAGWLEESGVHYVLYSSCNIDSLARDLTNMPSYSISRGQAIDMFPHTQHFECIVLLERR